MKATFSLFNAHLDLAHFWWEKVVTKDSLVLDLTCGNGHDTQFLASLSPKRLIALDIQPEALEKARSRIKENVEFICEDHALYPERLEENSVTLAVYNLGWLPGNDKSLTTMTTSTLISVQTLLPKITSGGLISITCYPGHPEGKKEESALIETLSSLNPMSYSFCHHRWLNRIQAPSLILLQKATYTKAI